MGVLVPIAAKKSAPMRSNLIISKLTQWRLNISAVTFALVRRALVTEQNSSSLSSIIQTWRCYHYWQVYRLSLLPTVSHTCRLSRAVKFASAMLRTHTCAHIGGFEKCYLFRIKSSDSRSDLVIGHTGALCPKNVPPLVCYNFDTRERTLIFFGRNVTDKVSNQKRFTVPPQIMCFCTTWQKRGNTKIAFFHSNAVSVHCQNSTNRCLISSVFLTHTHAAVWLLVINAFSSGLLGGMVQEKGSRDRRSSWTVLHAQCMCTNALSSWKKRSVICDVFHSV